MKKTSIVSYKNHHYKITLEINQIAKRDNSDNESITEGRLVHKVKYKSIKPKTPIHKVKKVKDEDEVNRPNVIK